MKQPRTTSAAVDKLNALKKEQVVLFYRETNCNITEACRAAEISRTTFYTWLKEDETFFKAIEDANAELNDEMEQALIERARADRSDTAIIFYLKNKHPHYKQQPGIIQQINVGKEMTVQFDE